MFCPSCGAAQIRVTTEQQPPEQISDKAHDQIEAQVQPNPGLSAPSGSGGFAASAHSEASAPAPSSWQIQRKSFLRTGLPLALVASLICLWNPGLGWLALVATVVWAILHHQRQHAGPISSGTGARLGALMGLLTFVFYLLLVTVGFALSISLQHNAGEVRNEMARQIQQAAASTQAPSGTQG